MAKTKLTEYNFLKVDEAQVDRIRLLFATKFHSLEEASFELGLDSRTISRFLGGRVLRRKHFLTLCKVLGVAPLVALGAQKVFAGSEKNLLLTEVWESEYPKDLRLVDFDEAMNFVQQRSRLGVVQIVDHNTNICRYTSKNLSPERLGGNDIRVLKNHDYFQAWKKAGSLEQYFAMRDYLERDGYIPGYDHRLIRAADGALVEYSSDFHLVRDFLGKPVRISFSNPQAYHVISA